MKYSTGRPPCVVVPASVKVNPQSRGTLMKFSQHLRSIAEPIWAAQLTHPFVVGLGNGTLLDATVVALPCAWIYCVVGQHLLRKGKPPKSHPYRDWLLLYASPEFAEVGEWMRGKVDMWAKQATEGEKVRLEQAFISSSRYEWMFWEMAWNEESWPV